MCRKAQYIAVLLILNHKLKGFMWFMEKAQNLPAKNIRFACQKQFYLIFYLDFTLLCVLFLQTFIILVIDKAVNKKTK